MLRIFKAVTAAACVIGLLGVNQVSAAGTTIDGGVIMDGRTMLPLRSVFESLEADVTWDQDTQTVTAIKNGETITLTINSKQAAVNGRKTLLDVAPQLMNDSTYIPVRFVGEALGAAVNWNEERMTVEIVSGDKEITVFVESTLELSSPKVGLNVYQEKTPYYEWTTKYIAGQRVFYSKGTSPLGVDLFLSKFVAEKEEKEGYFAFQHYVTWQSPTEIVLEMIPIPKPSFGTGYDFRKEIQYERLLLTQDKKGSKITSLVTWIPSSPDFYTIHDRATADVTFDFNAIRTRGHNALEQIETSDNRPTSITVGGIEKKYDDYRIGKWNPNHLGSVYSIYPEVTLKKSLFKDAFIVISTTGYDIGVMDREILHYAEQSWAESGLEKSTYRKATIYSKPIDSYGYFEIIVVPSVDPNVYYVGNIKF
jgi:hypothetical protein